MTANQGDNIVNDNVQQQQQQEPVWDPIHQIYVGGVIPDTGNAVQTLIHANQGRLRIFGYGSLCWKPGGILANESVTRQSGQAVGYQRCWCQRSTDHRGWPRFPGIVCTLLTDAEVRQLLLLNDNNDNDNQETNTTTPNNNNNNKSSLTEGVLYTVPPHLVQACLAELDFREKGGYERNVIPVVLDNNNDDNDDDKDSSHGVVVQAALYRGTVDNPALWPRVLRDPTYAAAVVATAVGPSGPNTAYLHKLETFLQQHRHEKAEKNTGQKEKDTFALTGRVDEFIRHGHEFYFLYGCGSNQHNQLLLQETYAKYLVHGNEAHSLTEILLGRATTCNESPATDDQTNTKNNNHYPPLPAALYAGGGHSALRTVQGRLFLFGWNDMGQCGEYTILSTDNNDNNTVVKDHPASNNTSSSTTSTTNIPQGWEFPHSVQHVALGFAHTLVLAANGTLYAMGDNGKGQVTGDETTHGDTTLVPAVRQCVVPRPVVDCEIVTMAAGLFHSAAITRKGMVVQWGGSSSSSHHRRRRHRGGSNVVKWKPPGYGNKAIGVACGRKFTIAWCQDGTVWSWGVDNKYGQLGRKTTMGDAVPQEFTLISTPWPSAEYKIVQTDTGWSHVVVLLQHVKTAERVLYGWGRNDKGQLGLGHDAPIVAVPTRLSLTENEGLLVESISCGSEFTVAVLTPSNSTTLSSSLHGSQIWACGWNEHGNLGVPPTEEADYTTTWRAAPGRFVQPPGTLEDYALEEFPVSIAAGGSHFLAMRVKRETS